MTEDKRLVWLAGFFDGEGSIELTIKFRKCDGKPEVQSRLEVSSTSFISVDFISALLKEYAIKHSVVQRHELRINRKPVRRVLLHGRTNIERLITLMYPHMITKKGTADILLKYFNAHVLGGAPTENDLAIAYELRKHNKRGYHAAV